MTARCTPEQAQCYRSLENRPVVVTSKPATLKLVDSLGWRCCAHSTGYVLCGACGPDGPSDLPAFAGGRSESLHRGFAFFPIHWDATNSGWRRNQAKSHRRVVKRPRGSPSSRPARRAAWMVQREIPRTSAWAWAVLSSRSPANGAESGRSPDSVTVCTEFPPTGFARCHVRATMARTNTPSDCGL